jgi:hypothetical protein
MKAAGDDPGRDTVAVARNALKNPGVDGVFAGLVFEDLG